MKYTFQHFVDIATSADSMQIINFNVGGKDVIARCAHLFSAYKYFKLGKVSVKFVPASTLPVDPLGMSYNADDPQTVDPRDQLNPGLVRITNGEDLFTSLTGVDATAQNRIYEAMLLDPRWYKFNLQSGFKRTAVPLYWQIGQLHQDQFPGATVNAPTVGSVPYQEQVGVASTQQQFSARNINAVVAESGTVNGHVTYGQSSSKGLFQVGHRGRLGYLPTDAYEFIWAITDGTSGWKSMVHNVPSIRTITCVLPKAYKTIYYYRVYITETVFFSGLKSLAPGVFGDDGFTYTSYRGIDNFIAPPNIRAIPPTNNSSSTVYPNFPTNNGDGEFNDY